MTTAETKKIEEETTDNGMTKSGGGFFYVTLPYLIFLLIAIISIVTFKSHFDTIIDNSKSNMHEIYAVLHMIIVHMWLIGLGIATLIVGVGRRRN